MLVDRLAALEVKHEKLHDLVEVLEAERAPDDVIKRKKMEKLKVKDEIKRILEKLE